MTQSLVQFWHDGVQPLGSIGAILVVLVLMVMGVSSILTPVWVWRLYRKTRLMETRLAEQMGALSRQQLVARLEHDRTHKKPRPRRRRTKSAPA